MNAAVATLIASPFLILLTLVYVVSMEMALGIIEMNYAFIAVLVGLLVVLTGLGIVDKEAKEQ